MPRSARSTWIALALSTLACGGPHVGPPQPEPDASVAPPPRDGGKDWWVTDAGERDASPDADASADGRDAGADAGHDAATDAGAHDAAGRDDAGVAGAFPPALGVTITDPWVGATPAGASLRAALRDLRSRTGRPPVARVVFDAGVDRVRPAYDVDARDYAEHVRALGMEARIMGELLDSYYVRDYSLSEYRARACEYRAALGHLVDVWEIGNEANGEWLGAGMIAKIAAAVEVFRADAARFAALCPGHSLRSDERAFELALTLYYNGEYEGGRATANNCWERADHAMQHWVETHFGPGGDAAHLRGELEHVLVSYYEDDCNDLQPAWQDVFDALGAVFTTSSLAIGECGTTRAARKARYAERYYRGMSSSDPAFANMHVSHPRYVGGLFWWYFNEDHDNPAFMSVLEAALDDPFWRR